MGQFVGVVDDVVLLLLECVYFVVYFELDFGVEHGQVVVVGQGKIAFDILLVYHVEYQLIYFGQYHDAVC